MGMQMQNAARTFGCSDDKCVEACEQDWERNGDSYPTVKGSNRRGGNRGQCDVEEVDLHLPRCHPFAPLLNSLRCHPFAPLLNSLSPFCSSSELPASVLPVLEGLSKESGSHYNNSSASQSICSTVT